MKHLAIILISLTGLLMLSCENFRDNNGDLGGEWQLLEWRTRSMTGNIDSLVANNIREDNSLENQKKLYYSIHRDVFQIRDATNFNNLRYFCSFEKTADSLILKDVVDSDGKVFISASEHDYTKLKNYGIPHDGCLQYSLPDDNSLVLSDQDNIILLRRY